jgi:hypothetical protein
MVGLEQRNAVEDDPGHVGIAPAHEGPRIHVALGLHPRRGRQGAHRIVHGSGQATHLQGGPFGGGTGRALAFQTALRQFYRGRIPLRTGRPRGRGGIQGRLSRSEDRRRAEDSERPHHSHPRPRLKSHCTGGRSCRRKVRSPDGTCG